MINYIYDYQFPSTLTEIPEFNELKETYYKGLCPPSKEPNEFCHTELLSFTEAFLMAPICQIISLYLPSLIYIIYISIKFYGWRNYLSCILEDPIYFIFPFFTNISFYKIPDKTKEEHTELRDVGTFMTEDENRGCSKEVQIILVKEYIAKDSGDIELSTKENVESMAQSESHDDVDLNIQESKRQLPNIKIEIETDTTETQSHKPSQLDIQLTPAEEDNIHEFSLHQSNVLYFLYIFGFAFAFIGIMCYGEYNIEL